MPFIEYFNDNILRFQIIVVNDGVDLDDIDLSASLPLTLIKKSLLERDQLIISLLKHELFMFMNKQPLFMKLLTKNSTTISNMINDNILLFFIFLITEVRFSLFKRSKRRGEKIILFNFIRTVKINK